jgi:ATP-binding cassette, subfamily F, member 3
VRLAQQETEAATSQKANDRAPGSVTDVAKPEKRKRKFPYRKPAELEREIAEREAELAGLEDTLGMPATWRDPIRARAAQQRHEDLTEEVARLYEHWEEANELNA